MEADPDADGMETALPALLANPVDDLEPCLYGVDTVFGRTVTVMPYAITKRTYIMTARIEE